MNIRIGRSAIWPLAVLILSAGTVWGQPAADTAPARNPRGFTLKTPAGWLTASKDQTEAEKEAIRPWLQRLGAVDLSSIALVIFKPEAGPFLPNINVVIPPAKVDISDSAAPDHYAEELRKGFGQLQMKLTDLVVKRKSYGKHTVLRADYKLETPTVSVHQWQDVFAGSRQNYVVTCTADAAGFGQYEATFQEALNSMDFDDYVAPAAGSQFSTWWNSLPDWGRAGVVVAAILIVIGIAKPAFSRKNRPPA